LEGVVENPFQTFVLFFPKNNVWEYLLFCAKSHIGRHARLESAGIIVQFEFDGKDCIFTTFNRLGVTRGELCLV